jgi:D-alanyl-D-alanine dipeptidase
VDAGEAFGLSERTVRRRLQDIEFRLELEAARSEVIDQAQGKVIAAATGAVDVLSDLAANARSDTARVAAARALLSVAMGRRGFMAISGEGTPAPPTSWSR